MGRNCGYMALMAGIAGGAEGVIIPEVETDPDAVATELRDDYARGKLHDLVVVAEGARYNAAALAGYFQEHRGRLGFELRATTFWNSRAFWPSEPSPAGSGWITGRWGYRRLASCAQPGHQPIANANSPVWVNSPSQHRRPMQSARSSSCSLMSTRAGRREVRFRFRGNCHRRKLPWRCRTQE
jgi:6-phosphofructokinase